MWPKESVGNNQLYAAVTVTTILRGEAPEEVEPAITKANEIDDRPVVLEFRVDTREKVFPMVPAGQSNDDIVLPEGQSRELLT